MRCWPLLAVALAAPAAAVGEDVTTPDAGFDRWFRLQGGGGASLPLGAGPQPSVEDPPAEGDADAESAAAVKPPAQFGHEGTHWVTIGSGAAYDFQGALDSNLHAAYTYFLINRLELTVETGGWLLEPDHEDDYSIGFNAALVFRYHHVLRGDWSFYTDAGIGLLLSTDDIPDDGTSFNLTPRAGLGVTRALTDEGLRLQAGVRWHHISNARITGEANNPARDGAMVYVGLMFPL